MDILILDSGVSLYPSTDSMLLHFRTSLGYLFSPCTAHLYSKIKQS